jgi:hyperosmotically inducible protein
MKYVLTFTLGVLVGICGIWYFAQNRHESRPSLTQEGTADRNLPPAKPAIDTDKIKDEMARTGQVIREKAKEAGAAVADATANARTTAAIKAKLLKEERLTALKIDVDTNDGVVTLSGTVSSFEDVARAMNLAMETDGVHRVISTLQVKPT